MPPTLALRRLGIVIAAALLVSAVGMKSIYAIGTDTPSQLTDDGGKRRATPSNSGKRISCATTAWRG